MIITSVDGPYPENDRRGCFDRNSELQESFVFTSSAGEHRKERKPEGILNSKKKGRGGRDQGEARDSYRSVSGGSFVGK